MRVRISDRFSYTSDRDPFFPGCQISYDQDFKFLYHEEKKRRLILKSDFFYEKNVFRLYSSQFSEAPTPTTHN